ncbi:MaoC family dehydratase N-terminal domain-containing protein [Rhodococcus opacus]|uniref:MaoC family dehydratase N-terminal domain-containing protein n=1 Tax=Rhodococcus opacus TaxID=37919 RepID=A0AAX3YQC3_RHOOP|nr:MaoC family dehydratase N-terminal domain-containing protein [Rhodococcus opacus]MCZ4587709.1 MaoC family dehydratase N-terminal domain-containing protein [Rhodococcus opacus]WLF51296.1 MaoC family dehydratase N-terminal domain-containing protein [Rhodococcus opacus]
MPPLNPNLAGRVFPPTTYLVGREKVREFARAVHATNALHHDVEASRAAGFADVIAPTTFTTVVQSPSVIQLVETPDTGLDPHRVVHGSEKIEYRRPIVAGDELSTTLTITDVTERAGNSILSTVCEIRDDSRDLVVTISSTLLHRGDDA